MCQPPMITRVQACMCCYIPLVCAHPSPVLWVAWQLGACQCMQMLGTHLAAPCQHFQPWCCGSLGVPALEMPPAVHLSGCQWAVQLQLQLRKGSNRFRVHIGIDHSWHTGWSDCVGQALSDQHKSVDGRLVCFRQLRTRVAGAAMAQSSICRLLILCSRCS